MRSVLITGGSGYFGRACVRNLLDRDVDRICVYSRSEHTQAQMREEVPDRDKRIRYFIGDVRDSDRLELAMYSVDTVLHAAALKRIEVCEDHPMEAVSTNVIGAQNVINAAIRAGVKRVVALSTDKACEPSTLYGTSKALAERMFLRSNVLARTQFAVTRYGNVAGSTGSVIPRWREAIKQGRGVTITDPECTRFWMTIDEAVGLVLSTAQLMPTLSVVTPALPAYRLGDLREAMGVSGGVIGLAEGEKRHEKMVEGGPDSSQVRRMSVDELREALAYV